MIHNRRFLYGLDYVQHYFDNLNPNFLFITGDGNPKFSTQTVGQNVYLGYSVFRFLEFFYYLGKERVMAGG